MARRRQLLTLVLVAVVVATGCRGDDGVPAGARDPNQRYEGTFTVLQSPGEGPQLCTGVLNSFPPQCHGLPLARWDWDAVDGERHAAGTAWGSWHVTGTYDGDGFTVIARPERPRRSEGDHEDDADFSPACSRPDVADPSDGAAEWEAMSQDFGPFEIPDLVAAWVSTPGDGWDGSFVGNVVVRPGSRRAALDRIRAHYAGPVCVVERDGPTAAELSAVQRELLDDRAKAALGTVQMGYLDERRGVVVATVWVADPMAMDYARERWGDLVELRGLLRPVD